MATSAKNFTINNGLNNEFIITIKQNDSLLPMVIVDNGLNDRTTSFSPNMSYFPYQKYVPAITGVPAVAGQSFIPSFPGIEGKVEINKVYLGTPVHASIYIVYINDTAFSVTYSDTTHGSKHGLLSAIKTLINASSAVNAIVVASVDNDILVITGKTLGVSYRVNTNGINGSLTSSVVQESIVPVAAVAGREYIASVPAIIASPAISEKNAYYKYSGEPTVLDLTNFIPSSSVDNIYLEFSEAIESVKANGITINMINGKYNIGTSKKITIVKNSTEELSSIPTININITASIANSYNDTFKLYLIDLETEQIESTIDMDDTKSDGYISVHSAVNGQIKIVMNPSLTSRLKKERGPKEDRYYLRPTYRIAIECDTLNNGNFVAKLENVYID